jgi:hypothetical protein
MSASLFYLSEENLHTSLRIEEVYDGHESGIEDSENNPEFPSKVLDADRSDFNDDEIGKPRMSVSNFIYGSNWWNFLPVGRRRHSSALGSHRDGVDLGRIQPGNSKHANTKGNVVEKEEENRRLGGFSIAGGWTSIAEENSDNKKGKTLSGS